jgi:hypothetical protein
MSRRKGWRKPEGAIYVGRTSAGRSRDYGNRYAVGETVCHVDRTMVTVQDRAHAVRLYREWFAWQKQFGYPPDLVALRGHDLGCWCPLDQPCHGSVLLELANG